jgi:hypothetical protein
MGCDAIAGSNDIKREISDKVRLTLSQTTTLIRLTYYASRTAD